MAPGSEDTREELESRELRPRDLSEPLPTAAMDYMPVRPLELKEAALQDVKTASCRVAAAKQRTADASNYADRLRKSQARARVTRGHRFSVDGADTNGGRADARGDGADSPLRIKPW